MEELFKNTFTAPVTLTFHALSSNISGLPPIRETFTRTTAREPTVVQWLEYGNFGLNTLHNSPYNEIWLVKFNLGIGSIYTIWNGHWKWRMSTYQQKKPTLLNAILPCLLRNECLSLEVSNTIKHNLCMITMDKRCAIHVKFLPIAYDIFTFEYRKS